MATKKAATKKTTVKKPAAKAPAVKAPAKRTAVKAPGKRPTSVRTVRTSKADAWDVPSGGNYQTFKRAKNANFFSVRITDQTIYWAILCFLVLALGVWVISINDKVQRLYDQIDQQTTDSIESPAPAKKQ